jgi:hypothetical protein
MLTIMIEDAAVQTTWSATRYRDRLTANQSGTNADRENPLLKKYPPIFDETRLVTTPTTVRDKVGVLLLWYLPDILTIERKASFPNKPGRRLYAAYLINYSDAHHTYGVDHSRVVTERHYAREIGLEVRSKVLQMPGNKPY